MQFAIKGPGHIQYLDCFVGARLYLGPLLLFQDVIDRQTGANTKAALVIEGESLQYALAPGNAMLFQQVGCLMNSAICCRVTPLQKAMVVNLFKKLGHTAIAIGDGANDVSMIQEAKVVSAPTGRRPARCNLLLFVLLISPAFRV